MLKYYLTVAREESITRAAVVFHMGVIGIWTAMGFDWALRSIAYIIRFKGGKWMEFQVM